MNQSKNEEITKMLNENLARKKEHIDRYLKLFKEKELFFLGRDKKYQDDLFALKKAQKEFILSQQLQSKSEASLLDKQKVLKQKKDELDLAHDDLVTERIKFKQYEAQFNRDSRDNKAKMASASKLKEQYALKLFTITELEKDLKKKEKSILEKTQKLDSLTEKISSEQTSHMRVTDAKKELVELQNQIRQKQQEVEAKHHLILSVNEQHAKITSQIHALRIERDRNSFSLESTQMQLKMLQQETKTREAILLKLEKQLTQKEVQLKINTEQLFEKKFSLKEREQRVELTKNTLEKREKLLVSKEVELEKTQSRINADLLKHESIKKDLADYTQKQQSLVTQLMELEKTQSDLEEFQIKLTKRERRVKQLESELEPELLNKNITRLTQLQEVSEERIKELEKQLSQTAHHEQVLESKVTESDSQKNDSQKLYSQLNELQKQVSDLGKENDALLADSQKQKLGDGEIKEALEHIDKLLEHLPHDVLESFVQSDDFKVIEKIFIQYGVGK